MILMHYWNMTEKEVMDLSALEFGNRLEETETLIKLSSPFGTDDSKHINNSSVGKPLKAGPEAVQARKQWMEHKE